MKPLFSNEDRGLNFQLFLQVISNLVLEDGIYLLVGDAKVSHGDGWRGVVESSAKDLESDAKFCPLDIAESFSQGVSTVVAGQIDGFAPGFNHSVNGHDCDGLSFVSGLEKVVIVFRILGAQEVT